MLAAMQLAMPAALHECNACPQCISTCTYVRTDGLTNAGSHLNLKITSGTAREKSPNPMSEVAYMWKPSPASEPHWSTQAACREVDPKLFFPPKGRIDMTRNAKLVCSKCPVIAQCREMALADPELQGVWGGTTEVERRAIRRRRR